MVVQLEEVVIHLPVCPPQTNNGGNGPIQWWWSWWWRWWSNTSWKLIVVQRWCTAGAWRCRSNNNYSGSPTAYGGGGGGGGNAPGYPSNRCRRRLVPVVEVLVEIDTPAGVAGTANTGGGGGGGGCGTNHW